MSKKLSILTFLLFIGCGTKAPGPILLMEKARVRKIRKITIAPVTNATKERDITPLVKNALRDELSRLNKYTIVNKDGSDATIRCTITEYIPFEAEVVMGGKEQSVDVSDLTGTKENLKKGHGGLWGALVDIFVPSHRVKNKEEYKYKTATRKPIIGLDLTLTTRDGITIYKASKIISEQSRIPDCYSATYRGIIPEERLNSIDFITGLALKELLEPLK